MRRNGIGRLELVTLALACSLLACGEEPPGAERVPTADGEVPPRVAEQGEAEPEPLLGEAGEDEAYARCIEFVKERIADPASATFPTERTDGWTAVKVPDQTNRYRVAARVDLGDLSRKYWTCTTDYVPDAGAWSLIALQLTDDPIE